MADTQTYHDRDGWIWFDGKLVPWREAEVHVLTHALHYASSVFEGQRAYNGKIFKLDEHSAAPAQQRRAARLRDPVDASSRSAPPATRCSRPTT